MIVFVSLLRFGVGRKFGVRALLYNIIGGWSNGGGNVYTHMADLVT